MEDTKKDKKVHDKKIDGEIKDELCDSTDYGEIMSSIFGWISSEKQKETVEKLDDIGKGSKKRQKKDV